jgi:O-antigen ligase
MRLLLALIICILVVTDMYGLTVQLAPGLSIKNAFVYPTAMLLVLQMLLRGGWKFDVPGVQLAFAVLVIYALLTLTVQSFIIHFPRYEPWVSAMALKSTLIDWAVFFFVFFNAPRDARAAEGLTKVLLAAISIANVVTISNVLGLTHIGIDPIGYDEPSQPRVTGAFGHPNETGTMLAALLPAYIAAAESTRGLRKLMWIGMMGATAGVMLLTTSRGAIVGLVLGSIWAAVVCRKYLSWERATKWAMVGLALMVPLLAVVGVHYHDAIIRRLSTGSSARSLDELSSGRWELWTEGLLKMMDVPVTLITGYGWNMWSVMAFRFVPHNQYLWVWFELGLAGLVSFILLFRNSIVAALAAMRAAHPPDRAYQMAFVFGMLILAVGVVFANLWIPWLYLWAYIGLSLRGAVSVLDEAPEAAPKAARAAPLPTTRLAHSRELRTGPRLPERVTR